MVGWWLWQEVGRRNSPAAAVPGRGAASPAGPPAAALRVAVRAERALGGGAVFPREAVTLDVRCLRSRGASFPSEFEGFYIGFSL